MSGPRSWPGRHGPRVRVLRRVLAGVIEHLASVGADLNGTSPAARRRKTNEPFPDLTGQ